jgi:hypothetical protein
MPSAGSRRSARRRTPRRSPRPSTCGTADIRYTAPRRPSRSSRSPSARLRRAEVSTGQTVPPPGHRTAAGPRYRDVLLRRRTAGCAPTPHTDPAARAADIAAAFELARRQGATLFELRAALDHFELRGEPNRHGAPPASWSTGIRRRRSLGGCGVDVWPVLNC